AARLGHPVSAAARDVALNVARHDLAQTLALCLGSFSPVARIAGPVPIGFDSPLDAGQIVGDRVGEQYLAPPDAVREEAPLLNLVLPLLVHLHREPLRSDLLPVLAPVLVVVADPPVARPLRTLEDAALAALSGLCGGLLNAHGRFSRRAGRRVLE